MRDKMAITIFGTALSGVWLLIALAIVAVVLWKIGKLFFKLIFGVISNTILGFITLYLANSYFGMSIPFTLPVIISTAIFGIAGIGTIVILQWFGIVI